MSSVIGEYLNKGLLNIIGGCCGTTPDHISEFAALARSGSPRIVPENDFTTCLSGLEPLTIRPESNFINIGERTNVSGSSKFARFIREGKYEEAFCCP
jgi:5-methyltetrahydrofolate--homocysteine methyltransferase